MGARLMYGLSLAAAFAAGCAAFYAQQRRTGLRAWTLPVLAALGVALGVVFSRGNYHLVKYAARGFGGFALLSLRPYEYTLCGALMGLVLAAAASAAVTGQRIARVLDALAPAGLLMLAIARFGEVFSDFGWGQTLTNPLWQFFPVAVPDLYGQWHLAVFMLEGAAALAIGVLAFRMTPQRDGDRFLKALLWLSMTQIFCESLRVETLRWGFVRVQQVQCACFGLIVLAIFSARRKRGRPALFFCVYLANVAVVALMEYALDKLPMPRAFDYAVMAAALFAMGMTVQRASSRER